MNLISLNTVKNMLQQHSQKPYLLYKFSSKYLSGLESKCLYIAVYLRAKTFVPDFLSFSRK